jgi:hypothetical protein
MKSLALDIGYVGSFGTHLLVARGLNQPLLASSGNPVNCGYNGEDPSLIANCITTNTVANAALRVPYMGETPTALNASEFTGISRYNGLQTTLRKQTTRGISFQVSYTFSKSMSNTTRYNDQTNTRLDWARTAFDRTHRLVFSYQYHFPDVANTGVLGTIARGWSLSGVTSIQSGLPITLLDRSAGSVYGRAATSTVTLCPGATYSDLITSGRPEDRLDHWIDTAVIAGNGGGCALTVVGSDGKATGYGTAGQAIIVGPGQNDWDFSVGKATIVGGFHEDAELQMRIEFYNAFNHPQFSNPGTTFGTASFGTITTTSVAPRLIQFGLKYLF